MKILFIGGTGNISGECAALLQQRGHEILVLSRGRLPVPREYRPVIADRKDPAAMRAALKNAPADVVINFLGYDVPELQADCEIFNGNVQQYIFISSTVVYTRPPQKLPFTEDAAFGNDLWDYAQKKVACERWLNECRAHNGFPVTIVRPSHTYSKHWIPNAISSPTYTFASRLEQGKPVYIPDDGSNPWTLTAASDFAVGLAGLVGNQKTFGEAFHITCDEVQTWSQIYAEIAQALGVTSPNIVPVPVDFICQVAPQMSGGLRGDKAHPGIFDNSKIKRFVPDFKGRKPFRVGIRESVEWLRAHPEHQNLNPQIDAVCDLVVGAWRKQK